MGHGHQPTTKVGVPADETIEATDGVNEEVRGEPPRIGDAAGAEVAINHGDVVLIQNLCRRGVPRFTAPRST